MIKIDLMGGLGNQMFQYAAAKALADRRKTHVQLDLTWFNQEFRSETTPRKYELGCFALEWAVAKYQPSSMGRFAGMFMRKYQEPHFHYDPNFITLPVHTSLSGYFQSEKYFVNDRAILLRDFSWIKAASGRNAKLLDEILNDDNSVSIHVRRGDYISNRSAAKFHGLTGVEYYKSAVRQVSKQVKNPNLYIFSDDPDWCKKHLKFTQPTAYIAHNIDGSEDMRLMKSCRHNIIANSSFSWWAAWLNANVKKIVIAPKIWFADVNTNTNDVIPDTWKRL